MSSRPPNFLFLGPDKAGSTWLYHALRQHREVYLPQVKELFFFDRFYEKGWRWYLKFFEDAKDEHKVVGEICHDYLFSLTACQRIFRDIPAVKLMVCLREPTQRAFSEYLYRTRVGLINCDFETAIRNYGELIDNGRYAKHLSIYREQFGSNLYVAVFDELAANPQLFFDGVCDFLGLPHIILQSELKDKVLPAAKPKLRHAARIGRSIGWGLRQLGMPGVVGKIKEYALLDRLLYSPYSATERPELSSTARQSLRETFAPEIRQLDALLGMNFCARWGYPTERV